ncbi:hypothetical protein IFM89_027692 [Coptis chinensis]|uniref:Uncharacterized protein n=1 Tax=Coptis chinensis TaxID=261450 RepID=A0A835MB01_9MAGN|nr:hypothetical protein IFM89_027692 [Coptis chinensis]
MEGIISGCVVGTPASGDELKESDCKGQVDSVLPSSKEAEVEPSKLSESLSVTEEEDCPICFEVDLP